MPTERAPKKIIRHLEKALRNARLEGASFGFDTDTVTFRPHFGDAQETTVDALIKSKTRRFRESWLIPEIEAALKWAKGE